MHTWRVLTKVILEFLLFPFTRLVCSDWNFLAILLGLSVAKAKYFCIWCLCNKEQILDFLSYNSNVTMGKNTKTKNLKGGSYDKLDQAVYKYFLNVRGQNILVSGPTLKEKVMSYASHLQISLKIFSLFFNHVDIVFRATLHFEAASFLDRLFSISSRALYFSCKDFLETVSVAVTLLRFRIKLNVKCIKRVHLVQPTEIKKPNQCV